MTNAEMTSEQYIDHEVRIRLNKERCDERFMNIDQRFDKLEAKIDSNFHVILVIFIASVLLPIALHAMKLI